MEGASGVQQQEELTLGLGAVPREEIMLQGNGASNSADHIDLATLQSSEWEEADNRSGVGMWEGAAHIPTSVALWPHPVFSGNQIGRWSPLRDSQHAMFPSFTLFSALPTRPDYSPHCGSLGPLPQPMNTTAPITQAPKDACLTQSSQQIQGHWER